MKWFRREPELPEAELKALGRRARRLFAEMDAAADEADAEADAARRARQQESD